MSSPIPTISLETLISIGRTTLSSPGALAIFNFTPQQGQAGTTVTILGQAFDPTAVNNIVTFNGTPAVVTSASATTLVVTVPTGATTGAISVSAGGTAAVSGTNFTVLPNQPALTSIAISPALTSIPAGQKLRYAASGTFADGSTQDVSTSVTWTSSNSAVAVIASQAGTGSGLATGVSPGTVSLTASSESITSNVATLKVSPSTSYLTVSPATVAITQGQQTQFTATTTLPDGTTQDVTNSVTWASSTPTVGTISNSSGTEGLAQGVAPGTTIITATSGSLTASATLAVNAPVATGTTPRFAFAVVNGASPSSGAGIYTYTIDPSTAQLRLASYLDISNLGAAVAAVAADPTGKFAYTIVQNNQTSALGVAGFQISPSNGALTPISGDPFFCTCYAPGESVNAITFDPKAPFLYIPSGSPSAPNAISAFLIDPTTGVLTAASGSPFSAGSNDGALAADPTGSFLYAANQADGTLSEFTINSTTGALNPVEGSPIAYTPGNPSILAINPKSPFLYVASSGAVATYSMNTSSGALSQVGSPISIGQFLYGMAVDMSGQFLYVSDAYCDSLRHTTCGFAINSATGVLTALQSSSNLSLYGPIAFDPSDQFLIMNANASSLGYYQPYRFNSTTGTLTALRGQTTEGGVPTATPGASAAAKRAPKFAYVANSADNSISAYAVDPVGGGLSSIAGSPFAAGTAPASVVSDLTSRFLFAADSGSNNISAYTIDPSTGGLTPSPGSPFAAGTTPSTLAIDPTGQFLFATNQGSNTISEYYIDPNSGALTEVPTSDPVPYSVSGTAPAGVFDLGYYSTGQTVTEVTVLNSVSNDLTSYTTRSLAFGSPVTTIMTAVGTSAIATGASTPVAGIADTTFTSAGGAGFDFIVNSGSNNATMYFLQLNGLSLGNPSPVNFAVGTNPQAIAIDPSDSYIYVVSGSPGNPGTVYAFSINNLIDGSTSPVPVSGSPFATGTLPASIAIDPSGQFAYVVNSGDGTVSVYAINAATGALTPISGSPFLTGGSPKSIAVVGGIQ